MNLTKNKSGFTLLEIIIVVIIVGVLASLALPKFFATVEYSRAQEALSTIAVVRGSLERYYIQNNGTYVGASTSTIDVGDPLAGQPNNHFAISIPAVNQTTYTITATRTSRDRGNFGDFISVAQTATTVTRTGSGAFAGLR